LAAWRCPCDKASSGFSGSSMTMMSAPRQVSSRRTRWRCGVQRLHEDDLAGHVLAQEPWEVVRLPAIAADDELHRAEHVFGRQSFGRKAGEALHPEREPPALPEQIRRTIGE
jgi:hypothetical protein